MIIFNAMPKSELTDSFFTKKARTYLESLGKVKWNETDHHLSPVELLEYAADAEVLIIGWGDGPFTKETLEKLTELRLIVYTGGSLANTISQEVYELGIPIIGGNDIFAKSVAEGCLCYILCALRRIEYFTGLVRNGEWREEVFENRGLIGKKVGIVGFGSIAKYFVELIRWFDCEVLIYSSHLSHSEAESLGCRVADLEEIFSTCDVVSVHSSLTPNTKGMINRSLLERLNKDALFVNTSRAAVVDEAALFELLVQGRFYAALDVFNDEPLDPEASIRKCENALLIPHMGGPTLDMREQVALGVCRDIYHLQQGIKLKYESSSESAKRMSKQ